MCLTKPNDSYATYRNVNSYLTTKNKKIALKQAWKERALAIITEDTSFQ